MANAPIGMILTAGLGKRLYPLSLFRPKPMMEIAAKPIIYFIIKMMENAGIKDIILNLHYQPEKIKKMLSRYHFKSRIHLVYEKDILNTAGGVANALRTLHIENRPMVLIHGDIHCDMDLSPLLEREDFACLICDEDREIEGYKGSVGVDDRGNIVELGRFYTSGHSATQRGFFTGIHMLSSSAVKLIKECHRESLVAEIYPRWLREGRCIKGLIKPLLYDDLGTPKRIFLANMFILKNWQRFYVQHDFPKLKHDDIFVGEEASIDKDAKLYGPLLIARGAHIKAHTSIGPHVIIGERSTVHCGATITNSVIMSDTDINKDESLDCTIGLRGARVLVKR